MIQICLQGNGINFLQIHLQIDNFTKCKRYKVLVKGAKLINRFSHVFLTYFLVKNKKNYIPIHRRSWSPILIASFESLGPGLIILLLLFFFIFCFQVGRLQQEHHSRNCNFVAELKSISFIITLLPTRGGGAFWPAPLDWQPEL